MPHSYHRPFTTVHVVMHRIYVHTAVRDIMLAVTFEIVLLHVSTGESYSHQFN